MPAGPSGFRPALAGAAAAVVAAVLPLSWLWGFTVDDALVSARVASHIAAGLGHRFNRGGPVVDAVTPLGWAYLLSPFARSGALGALYFAKWFGVSLWAVAAAWLGARTAREPGGGLRLAVLAPLALCAPLAAWCGAGMETGLIVALATFSLGEGWMAWFAAGVAAGLRPELVPWAFALCSGSALRRRTAAPVQTRIGRVILAGGLAVAPAALVAAIRLVAFGHAVPLSFYAKPSDFAHGAFYVAAALLWTGAPVLVAAPWAARRLDGKSRVILFSAGVHCVALVLAGGDWMALFRLFVPVLPGLFLVAARLVAVAPPWASVARIVVASGSSALLLFTTGAASRGVLARRLALIRDASPLLRGARAVAALDIGWVGTATDADVVDLAGITDESIGRLRGGHTSKRVPEGLLRNRRVDRAVLLADGPALAGPLARTRWARVVEARVAREAADLGFVVRATLDLPETRQHYVVLTLQDGP